MTDDIDELLDDDPTRNKDADETTPATGESSNNSQQSGTSGGVPERSVPSADSNHIQA
jgi:hypothetical protein